MICIFCNVIIEHAPFIKCEKIIFSLPADDCFEIVIADATILTIIDS